VLSADLIEGFKKAGILRRYNAGEPIFLANEPSTGMYLILTGEVEIMRRLETGEQLKVATVGAGQTMGEISLLLGQPHSATVTAKDEVECYLLTQTRLDDLRREDSDLALQLFEILAYTLAGHIGDLNRQLDNARTELGQIKKRIDDEKNNFSYF